MRTFAQKPPQRKPSFHLTRPSAATSAANHRAHPILHLQRTIGNQAVQRLVQADLEGLDASSGTSATTRFGHDFTRIPAQTRAPVEIQPKLRISTPGDYYEQEADRVAEQVVQRKAEPCTCGGTCPRCQEEKAGLVQRYAEPGPGSAEASMPDSFLQHLGPGRPLDPATRAFFDPRFGHDFSPVRVHTDAHAAGSAQAMNALAFTAGRDIFFATDQYKPGTRAGRWILAHELTHVIQQERRMGGTRNEPAVMLLTADEFRTQLGTTPEQEAAINTLFANPTFVALWDYLGACTATPQQDLGSLRLEVTPSLTIGGVERFGGYIPATKTLKINPTKPEHVTNPTELVDTITHELIHAVDDLETDCVSAGSPSAPLGGAATETPPTRAAVAGTPEEARLMRELGPGASNPCEEFLDINRTAQQMIIQILVENIQVSRVGRPTVTFVNEILRRNPAAMSDYETCRGTACARPTAAQRRTAVGRCAAGVIGRFTPTNLSPALLPTRVYFDFDAGQLRGDALETLDLVALFLVAHPNVSVHLVGHADPVGSVAYNLELGQRRAEAVAQELLRKGVDAVQLPSVTSRGEAMRLSTGSATHWKDRRVEITLVLPGP